jgi:hypothetical protein
LDSPVFGRMPEVSRLSATDYWSQAMSSLACWFTSDESRCSAKERPCAERKATMLGSPRTENKRTWLTGSPGFLSLVNQVGQSTWENTRRLRAQVDTNRKNLSTERKWLAEHDLKPIRARFGLKTLSTCAAICRRRMKTCLATAAVGELSGVRYTASACDQNLRTHLTDPSQSR